MSRANIKKDRKNKTRNLQERTYVQSSNKKTFYSVIHTVVSGRAYCTLFTMMRVVFWGVGAVHFTA